MKNHLLIGIIVLLILPLSACGVDAHATKVDGHAIYAVNVQATKATDNGDWTVHGTTKAPNNAKIIVTSADEDDDFFGELGGEATNDLASWATVHDGKFSVNVDPINVAYRAKYQAGDKCRIQIFAITDYHKPWTDSTIAKNIATKAVDKFDSTTLSLTSSQAEYFNSLDSNKNDDKKHKDKSSSNKADSSDNDESDAESESTSNDETTESSSSSKTPTEYTSALNKAENYATEMDMSKARLYAQLISASGEQFSEAAADYALSHLKGVNWNKNALAKAKSYQNEMDMAPAAIRDQLTSRAGEQFTQAQADYAMTHLQ
ncbi:Ltp family lipoprotein [Levilactobacillus tangyuanensis]|uniref:Ltp family lipoprotein n=1 Tax=Levilactobacillus tangyuanensis TaxID=2486021 RepID=A0ABW1TN92_9LACO|nr:Ltp family lipoprotein [Levilactobacillus tangyuanensis]